MHQAHSLRASHFGQPSFGLIQNLLIIYKVSLSVCLFETVYMCRTDRSSPIGELPGSSTDFLTQECESPDLGSLLHKTFATPPPPDQKREEISQPKGCWVSSEGSDLIVSPTGVSQQLPLKNVSAQT